MVLTQKLIVVSLFLFEHSVVVVDLEKVDYSPEHLPLSGSHKQLLLVVWVKFVQVLFMLGWRAVRVQEPKYIYNQNLLQPY